MGRHRHLPFGEALEDRQFRWPVIADGMMRLTPAQLSTLLEGLEWRHMQPRDVVRLLRGLGLGEGSLELLRASAS
jgi:transposase